MNRDFYSNKVQPEFKTRPKTKVASRGEQINRATCLANSADTQFGMILIAARMTREITLERRRSEIDPYVSGVDGLLKLQEGKFNLDDYLLIPTQEWIQAYYANNLNQETF